MITTCTVCQAKYKLEADKVPPRVIRVRCPACSGVFTLDGTAAAAPPAAESLVVSGYGDFSAPPAAEPVAAPAPTSAPAPAPTARVEAATAVMDDPAPVRRRRSKEEMLARALVSDIKVYNQQLYETAKAEGNLLEALGPEIKKSWELYKEKVTPEVANGTEHFRNALNEILADGQNIF
jgi:predicted Zn finger-like uncharacterized protein